MQSEYIDEKRICNQTHTQNTDIDLLTGSIQRTLVELVTRLGEMDALKNNGFYNAKEIATNPISAISVIRLSMLQQQWKQFVKDHPTKCRELVLQQLSQDVENPKLKMIWSNISNDIKRESYNQESGNGIDKPFSKICKYLTFTCVIGMICIYLYHRGF